MAAFPGIAPGLFSVEGGEDMEGKTLNLRIYVTGENLKKLERIIEHLNASDDVKNGDIDPWKKSDVYCLLFNSAIENFNF